MKIEMGFSYSKKFQIYLVGTGATGSQLLPFIAQLANNFDKGTSVNVTMFDQDIFEKKNLKNQKCTIRDIGLPKAKVLCERYNKVYPNLNFRYIDRFVLKKEDILDLMELSYNAIPIVISCVDNNASRKILHDVFMDEIIRDMIYIDSGNGTIDREGQVVVGYKTYYNSHKNGTKDKFNSGVYIIQKPVCSVFPSILKDNDSIDNLTSCTQVVDDYPQNIATNVMAASTIFNILNNIISFEELNAHVVNFSAETSCCSVKKNKYADVKEAIENSLHIVKEKNGVYVI